MAQPKRQLKKRERQLRSFGGWVTLLFSLGTATISTVAFSGLAFVSALSLPWLILLLGAVFLAETVVGIFLFRDSIPDTLVDLFVKGIFTGLSPLKKGLVGLGLICTISGGFAFAGLTLTSGIKATAAVFGLFSLSIPALSLIVASILGIFGFIAIACLFTKWMSNAIKNDIHLQIKNYFIELVTRDRSKSLTQQVLEVTFRLLFVFSIIVLTIVGTIATLGTIQGGLHAFLNLIPGANVLATKIASSIIAYGLTGLARLPLALQSVSFVFDRLGESAGRGIYQFCNFIASAFRQPPQEDPLQAEAATLCSAPDLGTTAKLGALMVHGASFGALAKSGGGAVLSNVMTDLHVPLSGAAIQTAGEVSSLVSGGAMAIGIAAFTFFYKLPASPEAQEASSDLEETPSPGK